LSNLGGLASLTDWEARFSLESMHRSPQLRYSLSLCIRQRGQVGVVQRPSQQADFALLKLELSEVWLSQLQQAVGRIIGAACRTPEANSLE
jgi:hypothetical protein